MAGFCEPPAACGPMTPIVAPGGATPGGRPAGDRRAAAGGRGRGAPSGRPGHNGPRPCRAAGRQGGSRRAATPCGLAGPDLFDGAPTRKAAPHATGGLARDGTPTRIAGGVRCRPRDLTPRRRPRGRGAAVLGHRDLRAGRRAGDARRRRLHPRLTPSRHSGAPPWQPSSAPRATRPSSASSSLPPSCGIRRGPFRAAAPTASAARAGRIRSPARAATTPSSAATAMTPCLAATATTNFREMPGTTWSAERAATTRSAAATGTTGCRASAGTM